MKTMKPISTISYNSHSYLIGVLDRLVKNGMVEFYACIKHLPEEDETKEHYHVYIEPCDKIDTTKLRPLFDELEIDKFKALSDEEKKSYKPLGVMPFQKSNFSNWYWYGIHDTTYLASKGEVRKHHYTLEDIFTNEPVFLGHKVAENPRPCGEAVRAMELMQQGYNDMQIAVALGVKISQLGHAVQGVGMLRDFTYRNGHEGHEAIEDKSMAEKTLENATDEIADLNIKYMNKYKGNPMASEVMRDLYLLAIKMKEKK